MKWHYVFIGSVGGIRIILTTTYDFMPLLRLKTAYNSSSTAVNEELDKMMMKVRSSSAFSTLVTHVGVTHSFIAT